MKCESYVQTNALHSTSDFTVESNTIGKIVSIENEIIIVGFLLPLAVMIRMPIPSEKLREISLRYQPVISGIYYNKPIFTKK